MDLKQYFRKIREIEATLHQPFVLVKSTETPDGGKAGVLTEVGKAQAARLLAEGRVQLATADEQQNFREQQEAVRARMAEAELARRIQLTVVSDAEGRMNVSGRQGKAPVPTK